MRGPFKGKGPFPSAASIEVPRHPFPDRLGGLSAFVCFTDKFKKNNDSYRFRAAGGTGIDDRLLSGGGLGVELREREECLDEITDPRGDVGVILIRVGGGGGGVGAALRRWAALDDGIEDAVDGRGGRTGVGDGAFSGFSF
jgi:hypothetical protein